MRSAEEIVKAERDSIADHYIKTSDEKTKKANQLIKDTPLDKMHYAFIHLYIKGLIKIVKDAQIEALEFMEKIAKGHATNSGDSIADAAKAKITELKGEK